MRCRRCAARRCSVSQGDFIAVVGANGSGKTSLLRLLHGVVAYTGSREMVRPSGVQAMVFQRPFLLRLSVWNNLRIALWLAHPDTATALRDERAEQALRRVGLGALRDRPARSLSGGEQQRLALARGWAVRPDILFLDEPTASLDPSAKKDVEALLADFAADGMTLVMSTHNLGQAKRLATRVIYMDEGRIDIDLPTSDFFGFRHARSRRSFSQGRAFMVARWLNQERRRAALALVCAASLAWAPTFVAAQERSITMASTTSTEQSGLFAHLLPAFKQATGIDVRVVAVGTGQALDMGRRGDADILFVHDTQAEEKLIAEGFGLKRTDVMYNDFIIVGPQGDPAGAKGRDVVAALAKIAEKSSPFISRGDKSGTHAAELRYWKTAGIDAPATKFTGYKECGCGMGRRSTSGRSPTPTC